VILRYEQGSYRPALELMRTRQVDQKDLATKREQIRADARDLRRGSWPDADIPPQLWGTMLDLIYAGHSNSAWQFLNEAWPQKVDGKEAFKHDFNEQLKKSP